MNLKVKLTSTGRVVEIVKIYIVPHPLGGFESFATIVTENKIATVRIDGAEVVT